MTPRRTACALLVGLALGLVAAPAPAQGPLADALVEADRALRGGSVDARFHLGRYHADPLPGFAALALFLEALTQVAEGTDADRDRLPCLWGEAVVRNDYFRRVDLSPYPSGEELAQRVGLAGPATLDGEPVPVFYNLSVNFKIRR